MSWSIIIFLYNEEGNIKTVLNETYKVLNSLTDEYEIIIVNDGSTDNSHIVIEKFIADKEHFQYINHSINKGIGKALISGYKLAAKQNICAVPGDAQFDVSELLNCPIFTENQFVSYYRKKTNYNLYRGFLSKFNQALNYLFLGIKMQDVNWIKVYKKVHIENISFELTSSLVESEICGKLFKADISCIEIESKYLRRQFGVSKGGNINTVAKALKDLIKLIFVVRKFKPYGRNTVFFLE